MGALPAGPSALPAFDAVARRTHGASHARRAYHAYRKHAYDGTHLGLPRGLRLRAGGPPHASPPTASGRPLAHPLPCLLTAGPALAHGVAEGDKGYIQEISGVHLIPFVYLGA